MIIRTDKGFEICSKYPNTDWYDDGNTLFVVDETTTEGKALADRIMAAYPFYDFVTDSEDELIDIIEYPPIQYSIDKSVIIVSETATITISDPAVVAAVIDGQEYIVDDGLIEYSNENEGRHVITLKAEGYYAVDIEIEVIA